METNILLAEHEVFETERLVLRKVEFSDAPDIYEYCSDEETVKYMDLVRHDSIEQTKYDIAGYFMPHRLTVWGIIDKSSGKFIGTIELCINDDQGVFGWIINKKFWGQGFVAEVAACLVKFAFEILELNVISSVHDIFNPNSGRVMEKLGMKKLGQVWEYSKKEKQSLLCDYWAITKNEYKKRKKRKKSYGD